VSKWPVREGQVTSLGLEGDRQDDVAHHGGPERALCLYALERILDLQAEGRIKRMSQEDCAGVAVTGLECVAKCQRQSSRRKRTLWGNLTWARVIQPKVHYPVLK
jgi:hypothetical protein